VVVGGGSVVPVRVGGSGGVLPPVGARDVEPWRRRRRLGDGGGSDVLEVEATAAGGVRRRRPVLATLMLARGELGAMDSEFYFSFGLY
jgi:hypothetical protein